MIYHNHLLEEELRRIDRQDARREGFYLGLATGVVCAIIGNLIGAVIWVSV